MQTITIGDQRFELRLNFSARDRMRSEGGDYGDDLDITTIITPNSRVPELLSMDVDYLMAVSQAMLIDQSQRNALREVFDGESIPDIYKAVTDELVLFSQPPRRAAMRMALNHLETEMVAAMVEETTTTETTATSPDDESSPVLPTSTASDGEFPEPSSESTPGLVLSAS